MLLLAALVCTLSCTGTSPEDTVQVYAAASLSTALTPILAQWSEQTRHPTTLSSGGTPRIVAQLQAGAPADLVLTADAQWMEVLRAEGLVQAPVHLLSNTLVLVVPAASTADSISELQGPIALAGAQVPAGRYAEEALREQDHWARLSPQARRGDNVRTVLAWVSRGEVNGAVVYGSDALDNPAVRVVHRFPESSHAPIQIWAGATPDAQDHGLLQFLTEAPAQALFANAGFAAPVVDAP